MLNWLRDWRLEVRIDAALTAACRCRDREQQRQLFGEMNRLIKQRSPEQVARMEKRMGLR